MMTKLIVIRMMTIQIKKQTRPMMTQMAMMMTTTI